MSVVLTVGSAWAVPLLRVCAERFLAAIAG
jgi:hypothetical protein